MIWTVFYADLLWFAVSLAIGLVVYFVKAWWAKKHRRRVEDMVNDTCYHCPKCDRALEGEKPGRCLRGPYYCDACAPSHEKE